MSHERLNQALWWLCLVIAPLVLLTIELFHPAGFTKDPGMWAYLSEPQPYDPQFKALAYPGPHWWFMLHMIQTPMVGLVAVGLWKLVSGVGTSDGPVAVGTAWLSRVATFVFLVYYTTLDSIGGSGLGRAILNAKSLADGPSPKLSADQMEGVELLLNTNWTDSWVGGVGSVVSLTGSWAVFVASVLIALSLFVAKKASWPVLVLLVAFGWELQLSHTMPHGPIAFACLIAASLWMWWNQRRGTAQTA